MYNISSSGNLLDRHCAADEYPLLGRLSFNTTVILFVFETTKNGCEKFEKCLTLARKLASPEAFSPSKICGDTTLYLSNTSEFMEYKMNEKGAHIAYLE